MSCYFIMKDLISCEIEKLRCADVTIRAILWPFLLSDGFQDPFKSGFHHGLFIFFYPFQTGKQTHTGNRYYRTHTDSVFVTNEAASPLL